MKKKVFRRIFAMLFVLMFFCTTISVYAEEEEQITPSKEAYDVLIADAARVFVGNKKPVEWKVGDKYFLHYTVSDVKYNDTIQSGITVTKDETVPYPHTEGGLQYAEQSILCEEGWTYFFRIEVTEQGFNYVVAKGKGNESEYINLPSQWNDVSTKGPYFGVWMAEGGNMTATLTHVHCYDEKGNDLGVYGNKSEGIFVQSTSKTTKASEHSYSFSLKDQGFVAVTNSKRSLSDVIYMEYKIENITKAENIQQSGTVMTSIPTARHPHTPPDGYLSYKSHIEDGSESELLKEGANYLVCFERGESSYSALVTRTWNGKVEYFSFSEQKWGTYNSKFPYVGIWIGEECSLTADFTDVKCYDSEGKNLGIQTNTGTPIEHHGDLEDYSQCEAVYYCDKNRTFITLDDECNASKHVDGEETSDVGTYSIRKTVLTLKCGQTEETYNYVYTSLTDKEGNKYNRLKEAKVTFYSKSMDGELIETVEVKAENGFKLSKPENPEIEGRQFLHWVTGDGEKYDFNQVVTGSMDLYAAWDGEDFMPVGIEVGGVYIPFVIVITVCSLLVAATVVGIVLINKKKKCQSRYS